VTILKGKTVLLYAQWAQRGGRGITLPVLDYGATRGWLVSTMPQPLYSQEGDPVQIIQEAGWALGLVWIISPPRGFRPWLPVLL